MFDTLIAAFGTFFGWIGRGWLAFWGVIKQFFNWFSALVIAVIAMFTDVLTWLWSMVSQVFAALWTLINGVPHTGSLSTAAQNQLAGANYFLPVSESWTMFQAYTVLLIAAVTIKLVRMIKKTFWAS